MCCRTLDYVAESILQPGTTRAGNLSLRQQRLTMPMLNFLRKSPIHVHMSLNGDDQDDVRVVGAQSITKPNEFVYLRTSITNNSSMCIRLLCAVTQSDISYPAQPLNLTLSILPIPPTMFEYAIFDGWLAGIPLGHVNAGASLDKEVGMCFVAQGKFEFRASVQPVDGGEAAEYDGVQGSAEISIIVQDS